MAYGASAERVPAKGGRNVADVNIFKVGMLGRTERGIAQVQDQIFSMNDFIAKCGSYMTSWYAAYIADAFFKTLIPGINVEMKVRPFVASDAVQAGADIMDGAGSPVKAYDIDAAYKGVNDLSAFGNKIAYKIEQTETRQNKLTADSSASASVLLALDSVEHWKVGYIGRAVDTGTAKDTYFIVMAVDTVAKTLAMLSLGNATAFAAATTTVYREDIKLQIALKDDRGVYQLKEEWEEPFFQADTDGLSYKVNHAIDGSEYVKLTYNTGTGTSAVAELLPADVATWTALTSGDDGTDPVDANWNTLSAELADEDMFFLLAPESSSITHNGNMAAFATSGTKCIYYGQSSDEATEATLRNFGLSLRETYRFAMIPSDKWIEVDDPINIGVKKPIPKVGHDVAHFYNMYKSYGIGKVAAGNMVPVNTTDTLRDSNGLVHDDILGAGQRMIEENGVNITRYRKSKGITNNSARTLSTDLGYIYQNQLTGMLLIKKSIVEYLQTVEQDQSGIDAQETHRDKVWIYLKKKYDQGVFFKGQKDDGTYTTMDDVVRIVNDFSVNTLADIARGIEVTFLEVVFTPPIEKPILKFASAAVTTIRS